MSDRSALDDDFESHAAVGSEPKAGYLMGRIHPHRLRLSGPLLEARVLAKSLSRRDEPAAFLIFGRPRSGTTLLVHLLSQVPGLRCDGELLHNGVLSPVGLLSRLAKRAGTRAYGVKLLSYQLTEVQRIRRPLRFFDAITDSGYKVVHLRRQTWSQTLSLAKAQASQVYFMNKMTDAKTEVRLDPERFLASLAWNDRMLRYEDDVMQHVPHLRLQYEPDLEDGTHHQRTVDQVCRMLAIPTASVSSRMARTGGDRGRQTIVNMDEISTMVRESPLAHLLPPQGQH
jgi:hypothetical protein